MTDQHMDKVVEAWQVRLSKREPGFVLGMVFMFPLLLFFSLPSLSLNLRELLHYSGICGALGLYTLVTFVAWNNWYDAQMRAEKSGDSVSPLVILIFVGFYSIFWLFLSVIMLRWGIVLAASDLTTTAYQRVLIVAPVLWLGTIIVQGLSGAPHLFRPLQIPSTAKKDQISIMWLVGSLIGLVAALLSQSPILSSGVFQIVLLMGVSLLFLVESVAGWNDFRLIFGHGIRTLPDS